MPAGPIPGCMRQPTLLLITAAAAGGGIPAAYSALSIACGVPLSGPDSGGGPLGGANAPAAKVWPGLHALEREPCFRLRPEDAEEVRLHAASPAAGRQRLGAGLNQPLGQSGTAALSEACPRWVGLLGAQWQLSKRHSVLGFGPLPHLSRLMAFTVGKRLVRPASQLGQHLAGRDPCSGRTALEEAFQAPAAWRIRRTLFARGLARKRTICST